MRVLMLSLEYPPYIRGGLGEHVQHLVPALLAADSRLEVHVLAPDYDGQSRRETAGRLTVDRVAVPRPEAGAYFSSVQAANKRFADAAVAIIDEAGPMDVIHAHDWLVGTAAVRAAAYGDLPLVSTIHATERGRHRGHLHSDLQRSIDGAERSLAHASALVIVCSTAMCDEVQSYLGVSREGMRLVPNAVDAGRFEVLRGQDHRETRRRYARPEQRIVFFIGRLVYEKGADLLVEALPKVVGAVPDVKVVIGGTGPLLDPLRRRVATLGLNDQVVLPGYISDEDRDRLYMLADCCVFPSRYEPFGIVALESMAAGTPVVSTGVGGLGTFVVHDETGITVYTDSVESLAWGIVTTLQDPEAARRRAVRAAEVVRQGFSWPVVARHTLRIYHELLS